MDVVTRLLGTTTDAGIQRLFAADPRARGMLVTSPHLADDVFTDLWGAKPSASDALALTEHSLSPAAIDVVIAKERRKTVLANLVRHSDLTADQGRRLLDRGLDDDTAQTWLHFGLAPAGLVDELASRVDSPLRIEWTLESRHLFDQDEMLRLLREPGEPEYVCGRATTLISHPNASPDVVATALAAYREARTHWDHAKSLPKPLLGHAQEQRPRAYRYAMTRPWEEADTAKELDLLAFYRPSRLPRGTAQRVGARAAAEHPPTFSGTQKRFRDRPDDGIAAMLGITPLRIDVTSVSDVPLDASNLIDDDATLVARALGVALSMLTPQARHTAVTLLLDGYPGNVDELVAACRSLDTTRAVSVPATSGLKAAVTRLRGR